jgi:hypothetical protein
MNTTEQAPTIDAMHGAHVQHPRRNPTQEITFGEELQRFLEEERIRKALPENSPVVQWVNRNFDEPPRPRNRLLDFLNSP